MNNQWDLSEFRLFVEETLKQWFVPGIAIAIGNFGHSLLWALV